MPQETVKMLWPTPILVKKLEPFASINANLVDLFYQEREKDRKAKANVYSSSDDLLERFDHPSLDELFQFISSSVFEIASQLNGRIWQSTGASKLNMLVVGAWFQIQNQFGFHDIHSHGNCSWSGVYYLQIDDIKTRQEHPQLGVNNGITRFYSPHFTLLGGAHMDMGNTYLQDSHFDIQPEEGSLIDFPSWLNHKAMPYDGNKDRIIISFNAQVHGERGNKTFDYGF